MILVGTLMAIASGMGLPGHMLMFGDIIDNFIAYDVAQDLANTFNLTSSTGMIPSISAQQNNQSYFCNISEDDSSSNIRKYLLASDSGSELQKSVALYSYYYIGMATGLLIASFLSIMFWNFSAYRQTRRMRLAFFRSIMYQNIGWFDVNPSAELNTRLAE